MKWLLFLLCGFSLSVLAETDLTKTSSAPLLLSNSHSWAPLSHMEDGKAQGILIDFWRLYEEHNGQPVAFRLVDWGDSIDAVRNGKAQVHAGLLKSPEREKFLLFTQPIFPLVTALFVSLDKKTEGEAMEIPIGVVAKSYEAEFMQKNYPDADLVLFDNSRELIQAAHERVVDAFVADLPTGRHFVKQFGSDDRLVFLKAMYSKPIHGAVSIENEALLEQIKEGIARIPKNQIKALVDRKPVPLAEHEEKMKSLPWQMLRAVIFMISLGLIWWAIKSLFGFGPRQ